MTTTLLNADFRTVPADRLHSTEFDVVFSDPPDNLGLEYDGYKDKLPLDDYLELLWQTMLKSEQAALTFWISFYAKWTAEMGRLTCDFLKKFPEWEYKPSVQIFTFGQHNHHDLGNCHRPLWRFRHREAHLYPDSIRVASWRQQNGDKRADPRGRVPGDVFRFSADWFDLDDVFDFTRVTGNSKQRRPWHKTQLNELLVERAIRLTSPEGGKVLDFYGGSGTTARVCKKIGRDCLLVEVSPNYCKQIAADLNLTAYADNIWQG